MIRIGETVEREEVSVPVFHTGIFSRSGMGKTTLIKDMIRQAVEQGFRVLIFDSKITEPEFEGMGTTIPFYLHQSTDPDVYRSLIESVRTGDKGDMKYFRGGFIDVCEPEVGPPAKDFADIGFNLQAKLDDHKRINGKTRQMYREIQRDHKVLMKMLDNFTFWPEERLRQMFEDRNLILRMPVRDLPSLSLQGLVVRSVVQWVLYHGFRKTIIVVDEAPNFVHQSEYNPAKHALSELDAQGRSKQIFGWYTGQTLTGFDKRNMKNLQEWILGGEMERNEVKAIYQTQTDKVLTQDQIKKLKVREFIVSTPEWSKLVKVPDLSNAKVEEAALRMIRDYKKEVEGALGVAKIIRDHLAAWNDEDERKEADSSVRESSETRGRPEKQSPVVGQSVVGSNPTPPHYSIIPDHPGMRASGTVPDIPRNLTPPHFAEITPEIRDAKVSLQHTDMSMYLPHAETKPIGTFTLQVTRLQSDSFSSKFIFVLTRLNKPVYPKEIAEWFREYGWSFPKNLPRDVKPVMEDGLVVKDPNGMYRLPKEVKVEEVPA